jgi:DNA-binding response OmpR family regulator
MMETTADPGASVLVVDDEQRLADLYASHLQTTYRVETAYSGAEALELSDDEFVVVLLDRRMPELPGDQLLDRIRVEGYSGRVVMVTAADPDFDIVDMPFDEYVIKPVTGEEIRDVVEAQLLLDSYEMRLNEYFRLKSKLQTLEGTDRARDVDQGGSRRDAGRTRRTRVRRRRVSRQLRLLFCRSTDTRV